MKWFESKKGFTFGNNPVESEVSMEYSAQVLCLMEVSHTSHLAILCYSLVCLTKEDDSLLTLNNSFAALELMPGDTVKAKKPDRKMNPELEKLARKFDDELSDEEEDVFETEFAMHKRDYYMEKMGYDQVTR